MTERRIDKPVAERASIGLLSVTRTRSNRDRRRHYALVLDGVQIGRIRSGESQEFEVAAGHRTLEVALDDSARTNIRFEVPVGQLVHYVIDAGDLKKLGAGWIDVRESL